VERAKGIEPSPRCGHALTVALSGHSWGYSSGMTSREGSTWRRFWREMRWIAPLLVFTILGVWVADSIAGRSHLTFRSFLSALVVGVGAAVMMGPILWARWMLSSVTEPRRKLVAIGVTALWAALCLLVFGLVYPASRDLLGPDF
jgi:hypothetical protein